MADRKCVEVVRVSEDGTVERWEGEDAARVSILHLDLPEETGRPGFVRLRNALPSTTRPLRKVTVVRGRERLDVEGNDIIERDDDGRFRDSYSVGDLLPRGIALEGMPDVFERLGPLCDFRVTVEAVQVKEEGGGGDSGKGRNQPGPEPGR